MVKCHIKRGGGQSTKCVFFIEGFPNKLSDFMHVTKDYLVDILPSWGKYFEVSLNIWVDSFGGNEDGWSELLRFTATGNDCCSAGDRIPALFVQSDGYIHLTGQVGTNGNFFKNVYIKLKKWIKLKIKQYPAENGKVRIKRF